jgi:hypothetical protein
MAFAHDRRIIADWQRFRAQQAERLAR